MPRPATGGPGGRPPRTSRGEILTAAHRLVDRDGWERLTIRRLAAEIGTSPATVYYHVRDKDDLLVQLLNDYADQVLVPPPRLPDDPRERIVAAATLMHDGLAARPWVVEVITADDLLGDAALWLVEQIIGGAIEAGADAEAAVHLYRHIWYYTAGEILIRARRTRRGGQRGGPSYRDQALARLDPATHPRLAGLAGRWPALTSQDTYTQGLRALIGGALPN
ncbi:MAG TPA: TetR/AcrR family transcriptional regulator [Streptosporangiaceae bacterium]